MPSAVPAVLVTLIVTPASCLLARSWVPIPLAGCMLTLWLFVLRGRLQAGYAMAIAWISWGLLGPMRVLEYGYGASVFDPYFAVFFFVFSGLAGIVACGVLVAELFRRNILSALASVVAVPVALILGSILSTGLSNVLNVHYK